MAADPLALARDLEQLDKAMATQLAAVAAMSHAVASFRSRVDELQCRLEALPAERTRLTESRVVADGEIGRATTDLERAEGRLAELERARRRRDDEVERAVKEVSTARDALADARASAARVTDALAALHDTEQGYRREEVELGGRATALARRIEALERVAAGATRTPGSGLDDLEGWASQSRAALFVARGTLEREREQIVVEANLLGTSVLGEELGASGVALVRRRLEAHLAPGAG